MSVWYKDILIFVIDTMKPEEDRRHHTQEEVMASGFQAVADQDT